MGAGVRGNFGKTMGSGIIYKTDENGYYGKKGNSKSNSEVRHLKGGKKAAKKFFKEMTKGYKMSRKIGNGGTVRTMPDGGSVTYRPTSSSDGSPVVEFHNGSYFKEQKIHFEK